MNIIQRYYSTNILKEYPEGYELEPGVEYDEEEALIVPKDSIYSIKVVMDLGDNTEIDQTDVARVE